MTGIIAAMECEAEKLLCNMTDRMPTETFGGVTYFRGRLGKEDIVLATCGVGKVFAASCAAAMLLKYAPDRSINTGVAGAVGGHVRRLDTVIATALVQHDMDTSPLGDPVGEISGIRKIFFETDEALSERLASCVTAAGGHAVRGVIATGDQFVASAETKRRLSSLFGACAAEMEGGAIAQVCYLYKTPFAVLRTMSDGADGDASGDFAAFAEQAAQISSLAILSLFTE